MSFALEGPRRVGAARVAAVVETRITPRALAGGAMVTGGKHPVAVLVHEAGETRLFPLDRRADTPAKIEALCPGAFNALRTG